MDPVFSPEDPRRQRDRDHIKLLAIFHFVMAGLVLLGIGFLVMHYFIMQTVFRSPAMLNTPQGRPPFSPDDVLRIMMVFYIFSGVLCVVASALNVISGFFLLGGKHHVFSIVIAALDCLMVPLGTALGVFTIIVLSRDSVAAAYQEPQHR